MNPRLHCSVALALPLALLTGQVSAQCDTLDFEGIASATDFSTQYQSCGVVFSSNGVGTLPQTYDYGIGSFTSVLHSYDWYGELRMDFVDPVNGTTHVPVKRVWFENPIDSEVDYIIAKAYDVNGNLLDSIYSASPDAIEFNEGSPIIAYVIMRDDQVSAYVIDNIVIEQGEANAVPEEKVSDLTVFPTLTADAITVQATDGRRAELFIVANDGRIALRSSMKGDRTTIDLRNIAQGTYTVVRTTEKERRTARFVKQ